MTKKQVLVHAVTGGILTFAVAMAATGPSSADPKKPEKGATIGAASRSTEKILQKLTKQQVIAQIDRATGSLKSECQGAKNAEAAFSACKDKCAQNAQTAAITPAELSSCGDATAEDCASQLVAARAQACIATEGDNGCKDEQEKLESENAECKDCKNLQSAVSAAEAALEAQRKAVAQAEATLASARAQLVAASVREKVLSLRTAKACRQASK